MPSDPNTQDASAETLNAAEAQAAQLDQGGAVAQPAPMPAPEGAPLLDRLARLESIINAVAGSPLLRLIGVPADAAGDVEAIEAQINKVAPVIADIVAFAEKLHASGSGHSLGSLLSLIGSQFVAEL